MKSFLEKILKADQEKYKDKNKETSSESSQEEIEVVEPKEDIRTEPFDINKAKNKLESLGQKISKLIQQKVELEGYKLQYFRVTQNTISPFLLNTKGTREAIYKDGLIYIGNEKLYFESDADEALAQSVLKDGDDMLFYTSYPYFIVAKKDIYNEYQENQKELQKVRQNKHSISSQYEEIRRDIEKYEFWEQYDMPFKFVVDIKPVLSGLSENSWGNGCNRATVYHVRPREDISQGKLKRKNGDYLCSQQSGRAYYSTCDVNISELQDIVTCKQCLKRIGKYKKVSYAKS